MKRQPPRIVTLSVGGVPTKLRAMSILVEQLEDGSKELTVCGYPLGDSSDSELVPNALAIGPARREEVIAERDLARASEMQLHTIKLRFHDGQKVKRRPGRAGVPGRWTEKKLMWNFVAMQRLIDNGDATGPRSASEILGLAKGPGVHHTLLTGYKQHRALLAGGNLQLLEMTIAAYASSLSQSGDAQGADGFHTARRCVLAALNSYEKNRRKRPAGE